MVLNNSMLTFIGYPLNTGQSACLDVAVGWANGSIVNPTLMPSSVGSEKHATQPTPLLVPSLVGSPFILNLPVFLRWCLI